MSYVVIKAFKSVNRKFKPGDPVVESDIDAGSYYTLADWVARGFVKDSSAPAPEAKPSGFKSFSDPAKSD